MGNTFFTSDHHFGHANVIEYAHRPFKDVEEMNETMIALWNGVVRDDDTVYHLGDFALCPPRAAINVLRRLKGDLRLIFGNHDKRLRREKKFLDRFGWTADIAEIKVADPEADSGEQRVTLCHYAMRTWNKSHYGSWQLYGHSHGSLKDDPHSLSLDVGVDCWDYTPVSYRLVKDRMRQKDWRPIDHHEPRRRR